MKRYYILFFVVVLTANCYSQEIKIAVKAIPPAVLQSFRNTYPDAHIKGASKDVVKKETYYEIVCKDGDARRDIKFNADGKLLETEELITMERLPDAVTKAITKYNSKAKVVSIQMVVKDSKTSYEILLKEKKKKTEVVISPEGKIVQTH
jgi:hypothetical protein